MKDIGKVFRMDLQLQMRAFFENDFCRDLNLRHLRDLNLRHFDKFKRLGIQPELFST